MIETLVWVPSDVEDSFCEDVMSVTPEDRHCSKYTDYLFENKVTPHSKFSSEIWAEIPSNNIRTKNATESFREHYNAQFSTAHPTIFVFLEVLVKLLAATYMHMRGTNVVAGRDLYEYERNQRCGRPRPIWIWEEPMLWYLIKRERKKERKNEFIPKQYEKYASGEIPCSEYINAMGYRVCVMNTTRQPPG